jgi:predicted ester cyclase
VTRDEVTSFFAKREKAWRLRDAATLTAGHAENGTVASPMFGTIHGRQAIEKSYRDLFAVFEDWDFEGEEVICEGGRVAQPYMVRATHSSDFFGVPPTGRRFETHGVMICTLDQHHILHERRIYDFTALLIQIGVLKAKPK